MTVQAAGAAAGQAQPEVLEGPCLPLHLLAAAETCCHTRHQLLQRARRRLLDRLPGTWVEKEYDVSKWRLDKAFACVWLDCERVLVATKCNQLLELSTRSGERRSIALPPVPARTHATVDSGWGNCGIHAIDISPSRGLLVTGGANPTDAVVLRLPDYRPVQTLTGHLDWVFGAAWVSDRHLVTGSRDGAIALWEVPDSSSSGGGEGDEGSDSGLLCSGGGGGGSSSSGVPVQYKDFKDKQQMKRKFKQRVREVKYDRESDRLAALGTEGCVKLFDLENNMRVVRTVGMEHTKELVCMAQRADLVAVGSCGHVSLADPRRSRAEVRVVDSPDGHQGVRSVTLKEHLLSFGTGHGKIAFVDMRTWQLLPMSSQHAERDAVHDAAQHHKPQGYLECGAGHLQQDELYWDHFAGADIRNACYAHAWDPTGSRLFACGGPLAFGLKGCYMALWR